MNNNKRARLQDAVRLLHQASSIIDSICDREEEDFFNLPEPFQDCDRGMAMENAMDSLREAMNSIQEAADHIDRACDV